MRLTSERLIATTPSSGNKEKKRGPIQGENLAMAKEVQHLTDLVSHSSQSVPLRTGSTGHKGQGFPLRLPPPLDFRSLLLSPLLTIVEFKIAGNFPMNPTAFQLHKMVVEGWHGPVTVQEVRERENYSKTICIYYSTKPLCKIFHLDP